MFRNLPNVTKNLIILNVLFYFATWVMNSKGIALIPLLGAHYMNSPLFEPFQVVTHFFMHSDQSFFHILFNMLILSSFAPILERYWGPKRFFMMYIASALGAYALYNLVGMIQIAELKNQLIAYGYDMSVINLHIKNGTIGNILILNDESIPLIQAYLDKSITPMVGASGAVFGVMAAYAYLFPNTQLMLLFPPIPIRAKFLIGGYFVLELFYSFNSPGDSVAHLAHVGGAIVGFLLVLYWNKYNKNFY